MCLDMDVNTASNILYKPNALQGIQTKDKRSRTGSNAGRQTRWFQYGMRSSLRYE